MARKVSTKFLATIAKNNTKGGAWLCQIALIDEGMDSPYKVETTAWTSASAGKRWVKERVQALTPRKSCKMVATGGVDEKGKPILFTGELSYKREI